jgi:SecD/SecF fusion protein
MNEIGINAMGWSQIATRSGAQFLAQTQADVVGREVSWDQWLAIAVAMAVLILPFLVGSRLAKWIRMPTYGTRFGWILLAITASTVVLLNRLPGLGIDLRGGTILVYEMDPGKRMTPEGQAVSSQDLIEPLIRRINPSGTQEIMIRPYGESQIEIIVPEVDQHEVDRIKRKVEEAGILRFAIVANQADHQAQINLAAEQAESDVQSVRTAEMVTDSAGDAVGLWATVDREVNDGQPGALRFDPSNGILRDPRSGRLIDLPPAVRGPEAIANWIDEQGMPGLEILMIVNKQLDITGEDLAFAASTHDERGAPSVAFTLTDRGSGRFFALTSNNIPIGSRQRQLGIILDNNLLSAPNIQSAIRKEGRITGNFTREEVEHLVQILKAGQLPAALTKQPIAENQIDATLGKDTIEKGVSAIGLSLICVLVFILFYYRFAGVIACLALLANLALILATMVLINQPLTLPGLAGLVLTVGMSVDANVLIFERIREELKKGAANRMAIRNGFAKATVTIIDANLTTLITAIVLYAIGTDQIRGFAVTLILGILFSMFTAIYVSRTLFDVAERHGFVSLSMSDGVNSLRSMLSGEAGFDFMRVGKITVGASAVLMLIGVASLFIRGQDILDIDFAGGSSVQFRTAEPADSELIRRIVGSEMTRADGENIPYTVNEVNMDGAADQTVFKVDSSLEDVNELKSAVERAFAAHDEARLVTYSVSITPTGDQSRRATSNGTMLVVARAQDEPQAVPLTPPADDQPVESEAPAVNEAPAVVAPAVTVVSSSIIQLGIEGGDAAASVNAAALRQELVAAAKSVDVPLSERAITLQPFGDGVEQWKPESSLAFSKWRIELPMAATDADRVMEAVKQSMDSDPVWISSSSIGKRVAGDMISRALLALFASLLCIVAYIWFRFQRVLYGFAAVAALVHDVLITLGAIAVSYWLADALGFLLIDPFKISLTVVAALLTIVGYSLNDTIVVFDRIRETKGKAPKLTGEMINVSINQTLSRTLLTSITTLIVVVLLYAFGGEGIHAFAFCLVVGVIVGTYSSIFIASPILLWLIERGDRAKVA